jgi:hypothetical protein
MGAPEQRRTMSTFSPRFNTNPVAPYTWLVLVGNDCKEHWVQMQIPDESFIRRQLRIPAGVEILVGRP